jgi:hypothetical protein
MIQSIHPSFIHLNISVFHFKEVWIQVRTLIQQARQQQDSICKSMVTRSDVPKCNNDMGLSKIWLRSVLELLPNAVLCRKYSFVFIQLDEMQRQRNRKIEHKNENLKLE